MERITPATTTNNNVSQQQQSTRAKGNEFLLQERKKITTTQKRVKKKEIQIENTLLSTLLCAILILYGELTWVVHPPRITD